VQRPRVYLLGLLVLTLGACGGAEPARRAPSGATPAEPAIVAAMVSPLTKETPLQVVSVFASEAGETLISPATELVGLIAKARTEGGFGKDPLRTLLLDPAPAPVKARRLLYVALGPRGELSLDRIKAVGATAMREALRLGVDHMAFAPIARDQGVTSLPPDDVAAAFVEGALLEYEAERRAAPDKPILLKDVTYEAGPPFIEAVTRAVGRGVEAAHAHVLEGVPAR
jgi:Cytosol aminopeptidase family, N-terminal domain